MRKSQFLFLVCLSILVVGCSSTNRSAPVVDRAPGSKTVEVGKGSTSSVKPVAAQDIVGGYTVKKGDTLLRIALDNGLNYRDLVAWNNLANPNDIKVDQVLRITPPEGSAEAHATGVGVKPAIATPVSNVKNGPRGDKKPYSEAALEELQKTDATGTVATAKEVPKTVEKPAAQPAAAAQAVPDEPVSWMWPTEGKTVASFDGAKSRGIDIAGKSGQKIVAAGGGKVIYAGSDIRGYGNLVIVRHTSVLISAYAHNKTILVKEGQNVSKGEPIAEMGNSDADAVKLHFEIRQQGKPVDPAKFLPNR